MILIKQNLNRRCYLTLKKKLSKNSNFQIGGQKHANLLLDKFLDNNDTIIKTYQNHI